MTDEVSKKVRDFAERLIALAAATEKFAAELERLTKSFGTVPPGFRVRLATFEEGKK